MFLLVGLTAVSAVDINQTDDFVAGGSDTVTQDILTGENDVGCFKELNDKINSSTTKTLELTKNYTFNL